jgi:hypothetical protein
MMFDSQNGHYSVVPSISDLSKLLFIVRYKTYSDVLEGYGG